MPPDPAGATPSAYAYPLLVKQLLHAARATAGGRKSSIATAGATPDREFFERLPAAGQRACGLGVGPAARWW